MFVHASPQVSFSGDFLGLNLDVWDWKNKHLAGEVLQKLAFAEVGFLMIPGSIFRDFEGLWDLFS